MNVRVEYESTPIRHIAVQCPTCGEWFYGQDATEDNLSYEYQIELAYYCCPICGCTWGGWHNYLTHRDKLNVEECCYPDVYKDCKKKIERWE